MSSSKRVAANRRNARKSTGPRSALGRRRSSMNALKHGLDAQTPVLPGEDEAGYRSRQEAWKADLRPRNPLEVSLVEQAVDFSWKLERADRACAALQAERHRLAREEEALRREQAPAEAAAIGEKLIAGPRPASPIHPDAPDHPERLLHRLESGSHGCRWLLDRWAELRSALEDDTDAGAGWRPDQRLRAVRLLGKGPLDAIDDPMVQAIYLGSFALAPDGPQVFADQYAELTRPQFEVFLQRLEARRATDWVPPDRESARQALLAMVDHVVGDLEFLSAARAEQEQSRAASASSDLLFDDSPEADRLHRLQARLLNSLLRTIESLRKLRRNPASAPDAGAHADPAPRPDIAAPSPIAPVACEEIRNEPKASCAEGENPGIRNEPTAAAEPMRNEPNPASTEPIRNEPTAAAEPMRDEPTEGRPRVEMRNEPTPLAEGIGNEPIAPASVRPSAEPRAGSPNERTQPVCADRQEGGSGPRTDGSVPGSPSHRETPLSTTRQAAEPWLPMSSDPPLEVLARRRRRKPPARPLRRSPHRLFLYWPHPARIRGTVTRRGVIPVRSRGSIS